MKERLRVTDEQQRIVIIVLLGLLAAIWLASLFVNFYMLFCYEVFITLMPIYVVAAWYALSEERKNIKNVVCAIKYHIGISVLYLMIYMGMRCFFPSSYDGNLVGSLSVVSIFGF